MFLPLQISVALSPSAYLAESGESCFVAAETVGHPILRPILFASQLKVAVQAAEVVQVPVILLSTRILPTKYQLKKRQQNFLQPPLSLDLSLSPHRRLHSEV